jgi:hypothetical protein
MECEEKWSRVEPISALSEHHWIEPSTDASRIGPLRFSGKWDTRFLPFISYWLRLMGARDGYPSRSEIDPIELGANLIPRIFMIDAIGDGAGRYRFRYRLVGQEIIDVGAVRRGDYLDQVAEADCSHIERHYRAALDGDVWVRRSSLSWRKADYNFQTYDALVLPLADDRGTPTHLLGFCIFDKT